MSLLFVACSAQAGTPCNGKPPGEAAVTRALELAIATHAALEASDAKVALIARVGQDLSAYGVRYSHMAFAWRDHPKGRWLVRHELNECGTATSGLYDEGLANFFLDDLFDHEALLLFPGKADQDRLAETLATALPQRLHSANYNMLSYAYSSRYQNSNQWVLETYAASLAGMPVGGREQAQAWLRLAEYRPITVHLPATTRLGARMFRANVAFDDHPLARRMAGQIDTVTVESIVRFVQARDPEAREQKVRLPVR